MEPIIERLLASNEPSIRYKVRTGILGEEVNSPSIKTLQEEIRNSPRVMSLLNTRLADGTIPGGVYQKWNGAHWILAVLADLGYPPGDTTLMPLIDQVSKSWLSTGHVNAVRYINGRARRCASQEGNALYAILTLGFIDERADQLAEHLLKWQWPDGGWNCDKRPGASTSSFHETWIPLRALALYAQLRNDDLARDAVTRAAEIFLTRHLFRRLRDGSVIKARFLQLAYPSYWHYGILNGLKVMVEAGFIHDDRCKEALDLLKSKCLPDGSFAAEISYYGTEPSRTSGYSSVKWGVKRSGQMNEWVSAEALCILFAAGQVH